MRACNGRRYNRETLEITYKGLNIADVLDLTVGRGGDFFFERFPLSTRPVSPWPRWGWGICASGSLARP